MIIKRLNTKYLKFAIQLISFKGLEVIKIDFTGLKLQKIKKN